MLWILTSLITSLTSATTATLEASVDRIFIKESTPVVFKLKLEPWSGVPPKEVVLEQIDADGNPLKTSGVLKLEPNPTDPGLPLYAARVQLNIKRPTTLYFRASIADHVGKVTIEGIGRPSMVEIVREAWRKIGIRLTGVF